MSDVSDAFEVSDIQDASPGDAGQAEVAGQEPELLPLEQFADKHVRVKVDGEEIVVPLAEALNGYSRQADYTRKTQEIAQMRQQLAYADTLVQALQANPEATIELLQRTYGVGAGSQPAAPSELDGQPGERWEPDPIEQRLQFFESKLQELELERAREHVARQVQALQARYGNDFNPVEVIQAAIRSGSTDLEAVYKQQAFDRLLARVQAQNDYSAMQQAEVQQRQAAAEAAGVVSGGSSGGATAVAGRGQVNSIDDAFRLAMQELGIS